MLTIALRCPLIDFREHRRYLGRTLSGRWRSGYDVLGDDGVLSRPIALGALLTAAFTSFLFVCLSHAQSEQPGLEADYCYPSRNAALAAFANGRTVTVVGQVMLERAGELETFEILSRSGDDVAVLLNSHSDGGACILIEGHAPTHSAPVAETRSGALGQHAASPRSGAR
jgi:hypothetical protein